MIASPLVLIFAASAAVAYISRGLSVSNAADLGEAPVAIVPGARVHPNGRPSNAAQDRLDNAIALYEQGTVGHILISGDNRETHYNEPEAMQAYTVNAGVPAENVTLDYAGFDTWDTCLRAVEQFGVSKAIVVTQDRYANRTGALCKTAGIDTQIFAIAEPNYATSRRYQAALRERLATVKAVGDLTRKPSAHHGGPFVGLKGSTDVDYQPQR